MVASSEHDDVGVAHGWAEPFDRCQCVPSARDDGEIFSGGRSHELAVSEVTKVAVAVDERQTEATPATQGELIADQHAAVAAENHRKEPVIEKALDAIRELGGIALDRPLVAYPVTRLPHRAVPRSDDDTTIDRAESVQEAVVAQRSGQLVDARGDAVCGWPQSEVRGSVDQRHATPV